MTETSRSEESFPPVEAPAEAAPAELDHAFFESHRVTPRGIYADLPDEAETLDPRVARTHSPEARRRRAKFGRYVRTATGAAAALCLIAFGKAMFLSRAAATADRSERPAIVHAAAPLEVLGESPLPSPSASIAPSAGGAASSAPDPAAAPDRKGAAKQKARAQRALDLGQVALAIEAGEQSVGLDPTDSEAWLLLGAAYQEKGDFKNARRCYKACTHEGKRGSKVECAAMLR